MTRPSLRMLIAVLALLAAVPAAAQDTRTAIDQDSESPGVAGPQGPEQGPHRRQPWLLPVKGQSMLMRATLLRPGGSGPFPIVLINHGSTQNGDDRARYPTPIFPVLSKWFIERGYAVLLPQRPGHGETAGPYFEDQGRCANPDFRRAGLATAGLIQSAVDYIVTQPFVQKSGVVVVGQSAGGWGTIALTSQNPPIVKAAINFAGGRGGHMGGKPDSNCSPDRLVAAAGAFGRTARLPMLWFYAENDSYFGPALSQRMVAAFRDAGGRAEFHLLQPFGKDGHSMIQSQDAAVWWGPILERYLAARK